MLENQESQEVINQLIKIQDISIHPVHLLYAFFKILILFMLLTQFIRVYGNFIHENSHGKLGKFSESEG